MTDIIYPKHEQHWPDHKLPKRLQEYVLDDGRPPTLNRAFAKRVTGQEVLEAVSRVQKKTGLLNIDPRYYVATCFHEAGCTNEWDTEIATNRAPNGFVTVGAFQISQEEAERFQHKLEDMLDLNKSANVFVRLSESNRAAVRSAAGIPERSPDPDYTDDNGVVWKGGMVRAYLALAHNKGVGFVRQTIKTYGMDWKSYKLRNPMDNIVAHKYAEDCITGGPYWPGSTPEAVGKRELKLTKPFMTGEDVKELQRHLELRDDGVFGPKTKAAVTQFQEANDLVADGVCGPKTWGALLAK